MIQNIWKPFHNKKLIFLYILLTVVLFFVWWTFTDIEIMYGNYGSIHTNIDISLSLVMIFGFPLFLIGILYK